VLRSKEEILEDVKALVWMRRNGLLGGEKMPEDARPDLPGGSKEIIHYLTLPMALNYQRNSYKLWEAATKTFNDPSTRSVFDPFENVKMPEENLREMLLKHKVALQPQKHIQTWRTLSQTIVELFDGDIRNLFLQSRNSAREILEFIQKTHKKRFPYLSGNKIANYWLYVIHSYTSLKLKDPEALSVAPDTHVIQASVQLGVCEGNPAEIKSTDVAQRWKEILMDSGLAPIDIHTPLWLWSRGGFAPIAKPKIAHDYQTAP
jgi:hypothetical protein